MMDTEYFDDVMAVGPGSEVAHLKRLQVPPTVQFSLKPTWGVSRLRDETSTANGGTVAETGGEIQVSTSTNANGTATLTTLERGQYRPGTWVEPSIGVRIPNADSLSGSQDARWGYFDGQNGFGWGVDSDGVYTFRQSGGAETKYRPSDWQDGAITTEDLANGLVTHTVFRWYGHGPARWYGEPKLVTEHYANERQVDHRVWPDEVSVIDPNQPIRVEVDNGGTSGTDLSVFVGGRQYALWGEGATQFEQRSTPVFERGYSISATGTWESVMALRAAPNHGPSGRTNTVRCAVRSFDAIADKLSEMRLTFDASVSGVTWKTPEDIADAETAIQRSSTTTFTVDDPGRPVPATLVDNDGGTITPAEALPFGTNSVALLQVRSATSSATFDSILGKIQEQW